MKNTNITTEERAHMTSTQLNLRIESGEDIDPREEVVVVEATEDSIFAEVDANRAAGYGEHVVILESREVKKSVQIVKNGVTTETKPYVLITFLDTFNGERIEKRLYAGMVESLRSNINRQYAGVAAPMKTSTMLNFLASHPISIWTRWDSTYNKVEVDFFNRTAWEAEKAEKAKVAASSRKGSKRRAPEDKVVK